jgi:hypothetical protein
MNLFVEGCPDCRDGGCQGLVQFESQLLWTKRESRSFHSPFTSTYAANSPFTGAATGLPS